MSSIAFDMLIDPALWVTLSVLSVVLLAWYAWRRPPGMPRRRWILSIGLMGTGVALVLFVLLNPTWLEPIPPPAGKPLLTLLVDESASMATADVAMAGVEKSGGSKTTRFRRAAELAQSIPKKLQSQFDVRVALFSDTVKSAEATQLLGQQPAGISTNLTTALSGAVKEDRPQGQAIMLLSDGHHNGGGSPDRLLASLRMLRAMNVPVYPTTLGQDTRINDLELIVRRPQEVAFVGQTVPVAVGIRQHGAIAANAEINLTKDGKPIDQLKMPLQADGFTEAHFEIRSDEAGLFRYEIRTATQVGEASGANNTATLLVRVVSEPVRVLLLEGKPYWDAKFLIRTIASDPSVELDGVVRLSDSRFIKRSLRLVRPDDGAKAKVGEAAEVEQSEAAPTAAVVKEGESTTAGNASDGAVARQAAEAIQRTETSEILEEFGSSLAKDDALAKYQIIILGRDSEVYLNETFLEQLMSWISRDGGALLCYRGAPVARVNQQLARVLPVSWDHSRESRFRFDLTARGESFQWFGTQPAERDILGQLPSLATGTAPQVPKPLAVVLATSQGNVDAPVVTYHPYGIGRVIAVEGAGMWRWAFLPPQYREHDYVYSTLWQSLLRWLVAGVGLTPGKNAVLRTDKVSYTDGENVQAVLMLREESTTREVPAVKLVRDDGDDAEAQSIRPVPLGDEPGVYRVPFGRLEEGHYRARTDSTDDTGPDTATEVAFDVKPFAAELLDVAARPDLMQRIAEETDGTVLEASNAEAVATEFLQHLARSRPERVRRITAWDRWWVLMSVLAVWGSAWGIRRASGLV